MPSEGSTDRGTGSGILAEFRDGGTEMAAMIFSLQLLQC
jgi:hypothetical protein